MAYLQSGEVILGRANRQAVYTAFPTPPSITPYRTTASGDIVVSEAIFDYGTDDRYDTVFKQAARPGRAGRSIGEYFG